MKNSSSSVASQNKNTVLKISFISIGSGIDSNAKENIDNYISKFNKDNSTDIKPIIKHWGREGETDYCIDLSKLNTDKQKEFISDVKNASNKSELVQFTESAAKCDSN